MTVTDYHVSLKARAAAILAHACSHCLSRVVFPTALFAVFTTQAAATPSAELAMTCTSAGSVAHVQSLNKPYEATGQDVLAGKTLSVTASVITKPGLKVFVPKPKQPLYQLELSMQGERFIGIAAQTFDETPLSAYSERIALIDAFGSGSSLMLLADGTGVWKGRVISTEGILDGRTTDVTIYIALTCREAEQ